MKDQFGREIDYMRISVTDRCSLRCIYCMPDGIRRKVSHTDILRSEEIEAVACAASRLGIRHLKVTGGEPLVRKGCAELVGELKKIPGISTVTLTTNGLLLEENLEALKKCGCDGINISLDTTDPDKFRRITGISEMGREGRKAGRMPSAETVVRAIRLSAESGIRTKVNVVTMPDTDPEEMIRLAEELPVDVRFIEMMPIGYGKLFPDSDNRAILGKLLESHPDMKPESPEAEALLYNEDPGNPEGRSRQKADRKDTEGGESRFSFSGRDSSENITHGPGPAVYFRIPGFSGSIGFISAIHGKFCASCNRVRLTSAGFLKTCLSYGDGVDLREILRDQGLDMSGREAALTAAMRAAILGKPRAHCFETPEKITEGHEMSQIGG